MADTGRLLNDIIGSCPGVGVLPEVIEWVKTQQMKAESNPLCFISSHLQTHLEQTEFANKLDGNWLKVPFANGTYDISKRVLIPFSKSDYFTKTVGYRYDQTVQSYDCDLFLESIMPDITEREYLLWHCAQLLTNINSNDSVCFLIGAGSNGKTMLIRLLQLTLGPLAVAASSALFTRAEPDASQARPEMEALRQARGAFLSKPEDKKISSEIFKKLCGAETFSTRTLYSAAQYPFLLRTKFIVSSNTVPRFTTNDKAVWRRVTLIPFKIRFVHSPHGLFEREIDTTIRHKIDNDNSLNINLNRKYKPHL